MEISVSVAQITEKIKRLLQRKGFEGSRGRWKRSVRRPHKISEIFDMGLSKPKSWIPRSSRGMTRCLDSGSLAQTVIENVCFNVLQV